MLHQHETLKSQAAVRPDAAPAFIIQQSLLSSDTVSKMRQLLSPINAERFEQAGHKWILNVTVTPEAFHVFG